MEELQFRLDAFEGPLDLLLRLIAKNKLNIYDIPIAVIFDQYMEYLGEMQSMDMDIAGDFIVMASELMLIKSRMLLPRQPEENDPRAPLTEALVEYKKVKLAAEYFGEQLGIYGGRIAKDISDIAPDTSLLPQSADALTRAFRRIYERMDIKSTDETKNLRTIDELVHSKIVPVRACIIGIMKYLYKYGKTDFDTLMSRSESRSALVASFAALLELLRARRVELSEEINEEMTGTQLYFKLSRERRDKHERQNPVRILGDD
ncbi:MAG: segregation/condensation protein A [Eubacteriales bacterium]